jgi:hypothetical protein
MKIKKYNTVLTFPKSLPWGKITFLVFSGSIHNEEKFNLWLSIISITFIWIPVPSQESKRSCICVLVVSICLFLRFFCRILEMLRQCCIFSQIKFLFIMYASTKDEECYLPSRYRVLYTKFTQVCIQSTLYRRSCHVFYHSSF